MLAAIITPSRMGIITSFSTTILYCGWLSLSAGKSGGSIVRMMAGSRALLYIVSLLCGSAQRRRQAEGITGSTMCDGCSLS